MPDSNVRARLAPIIEPGGYSLTAGSNHRDAPAVHERGEPLMNLCRRLKPGDGKSFWFQGAYGRCKIAAVRNSKITRTHKFLIDSAFFVIHGWKTSLSEERVKGFHLSIRGRSESELLSPA